MGLRTDVIRFRVNIEDPIFNINNQLPLGDVFICCSGDLEGGRHAALDRIRYDLHAAHLHRVVFALIAVLDIGDGVGRGEEEETNGCDGEEALLGRHGRGVGLGSPSGAGG